MSAVLKSSALGFVMTKTSSINPSGLARFVLFLPACHNPKLSSVPLAIVVALFPYGPNVTTSSLFTISSNDIANLLAYSRYAKTNICV